MLPSIFARRTIDNPIGLVLEEACAENNPRRFLSKHGFTNKE